MTHAASPTEQIVRKIAAYDPPPTWEELIPLSAVASIAEGSLRADRPRGHLGCLREDLCRLRHRRGRHLHRGRRSPVHLVARLPGEPARSARWQHCRRSRNPNSGRICHCDSACDRLPPLAAESRQGYVPILHPTREATHWAVRRIGRSRWHSIDGGSLRQRSVDDLRSGPPCAMDPNRHQSRLLRPCTGCWLDAPARSLDGALFDHLRSRARGTEAECGAAASRPEPTVDIGRRG